MSFKMENFKDPILEYNDNALEAILAKYGLDGPGRLDEAVNILEDWVKKQAHFRKKDFPRRYLEATIVARKGSIERSKVLLDKYCTMKTLTPQFFGRIDVSRDIRDSLEKEIAILLPKQTKDNYRVLVFKILKTGEAADRLNFFKYNVVLAEYTKMHDCSDGMVAIVDLTAVNLAEVLAKVDLIASKQMNDIQMNGFGTRLINHHIITDSKMVGAAVAILKQLVSEKVGSRIIVHKTPVDLHNYLDKRILPKDYGGEEKSIRELQDLWIKTLSSEEHLQHLEEMTEANTDESFRSSDKFSEEYAGVAGTFRVLKVD